MAAVGIAPQFEGALHPVPQHHRLCRQPDRQADLADPLSGKSHHPARRQTRDLVGADPIQLTKHLRRQ